MLRLPSIGPVAVSGGDLKIDLKRGAVERPRVILKLFVSVFRVVDKFKLSHVFIMTLTYTVTACSRSHLVELVAGACDYRAVGGELVALSKRDQIRKSCRQARFILLSSSNAKCRMTLP